MQTEKEKFEKWYREYYGKALGWDFRGAETSGGWYYFDDDVENFWQAWKARAALDRAAPRQVADCGVCGSQILVGAFPAPPAAPKVPEDIDPAELTQELERAWLRKTLLEVQEIADTFHEGPFQAGMQTALEEIAERCKVAPRDVPSDAKEQNNG